MGTENVMLAVYCEYGDDGVARVRPIGFVGSQPLLVHSKYGSLPLATN